MELEKKRKIIHLVDVVLITLSVVLFLWVAIQLFGKVSIDASCEFNDIVWAEDNSTEPVYCAFSLVEGKCPLPTDAKCSFKISGNGLKISNVLGHLN